MTSTDVRSKTGSQPVVFTPAPSATRKMTRRQLLKASVAVGGSLLVGNTFIAGDNAAWAMELNHLRRRGERSRRDSRR